MGKKRGQAFWEIFRYILIILIAGMIIFFGVRAFNRLRESSCKTELMLFEENLKKSVYEASTQIGGINEIKIGVPCRADRIYFADIKKNLSSFAKSVYDLPMVADFIISGVKENAVVIKDGKVIGSFYAGDIELRKPYFVCSDTSRGMINLYLSGRGDSTEIVNKECSNDCTFELVTVDEDTARELINDAEDFGCDGCPKGSVEEEMENFRRTNQAVKIARRCNCGRKPGEAVVEILIKSEGEVKHFKLIEKIPKEYIADLERYIENISGNYNYYRILYDPLMMWHFNEISGDTIIRYTLNKDIPGYCGDVLKAIGIGVTPQSEGASDESMLDVITKDVPELELSDTRVPLNVKGYPAFDKLIWQYLKSSLMPREKKGFTYKISSDGSSWGNAVSSGGLQCSLGPDLNLTCSTGNSFSEGKFYLRVLDSSGSEIAEDDFNILPFYCSGLIKKSCNSNPSCEWCAECSGKRWSGNSEDKCVDKGDCNYGCDLNHCDAGCDSTSNCYDGCYDGMHYYTCGSMGCGINCACNSTPSSPPNGCNAALDTDSDGYQAGCDCIDNVSAYPYAANVYPGSSELYCNCNADDGYNLDISNTAEGACSDGHDNDCDGCVDSADADCGGSETCWDGNDNNCNGEVDEGCLYKLRCREYSGGGCDSGCGGRSGRSKGSCCKKLLWWCRKYDYRCYDDRETECSTSPSCGGGSVIDTVRC